MRDYEIELEKWMDFNTMIDGISSDAEEIHALLAEVRKRLGKITDELMGDSNKCFSLKQRFRIAGLISKVNNFLDEAETALDEIMEEVGDLIRPEDD